EEVGMMVGWQWRVMLAAAVMMLIVDLCRRGGDDGGVAVEGDVG
nr:hypothetical protein [Tanacetum cinerariifolium]